MGHEVNLLKDYPRVERDLTQRLEAKSDETRKVARKFDFEYFDGERDEGYGGFHYNPRFWQPVVPTIIDHFELGPSSSFLDVGCAKGFLLHDLAEALPGINLKGIDISRYAVENAIESQKNNVMVGTAEFLPYEDNSFDAVVSINTVHNLDIEGCARALSEIQRVSGGRAFVTVDAYRNEAERERMEAWNLTALTMMSTEEWKSFFRQVGYEGDYYWFIP